jgi:hypothetical protein
MEYKSIQDIKGNDEIAIVINVSTKYLTTLAILSLKKYTPLPVLVINCPLKNDDGSYDYFIKLMRDIDFDLLSLPLRSHGSTLDYIFQNIECERVLLLDSDAELKSKEIISLMLNESRKDNFFGAGFKHEHRRQLDDIYNLDNGIYCERMWLPTCILNVKHIREALSKGLSFNVKTLYCQNQKLNTIARKWYHRYKISFFRNNRLSFLSNIFKFKFLNIEAEWIFCDTGAIVFQYLCYIKQYDYFGLTEMSYQEYVIHALGATRGLMSDDVDAVKFESNEYHINRIMEIYNVNVRIYG